MRHINEPPPPIRDKRPDVSPRVEAAVQKAMAKDPADRFPTMAAFCQELDACLAEGSDAGTQVIRPAPGPTRAHRHRRSVSPWPFLVLLVALIAIGAVVAVLLLRNHTSGDGGATTSSGGAPVHLTAVRANDPYGTNGEHDELVPQATDGNAATYWKTEHYDNAPSLGKPGVGLVLDAGSAKEVHQIGIATQTPGFTAVIKGGDSPTSFTADLSAAQTIEDGTRIRLTGGGRYRYYELWITRLGDGFNDARINEVRAN